MWRQVRMSCVWGAMGAACAGWAWNARAQDRLQSTAENLVEAVQNVLVVVDANAPESEYWIGVSLEPLPEVAKQQLGLEHGLVVGSVMDLSPAAKAEIKAHDILVKIADRPVKEASDLIEAVAAAKEKPVTLTIVRGGKDRTVEVRPAKRPEQAAAEEAEAMAGLRLRTPEFREEIKRLEEALDKLKSKTGNESLGLWFARPGVVTTNPLETPKRAEFPKDLQVSINKSGSEPAKIHVEKGGKTWDVTEDQLGDLPGDVRPHVEQMLGRRVNILSEKPVGPPTTVKRNVLRVAPGGKVEGEIRVSPVPPPAAPQPPLPPQAVPPPYGAPTTARVAPLHAYRVVEVEKEEVGARLKRLESKVDDILKALDREVRSLREDVKELREKSSDAPSEAEKS